MPFARRQALIIKPGYVFINNFFRGKISHANLTIVLPCVQGEKSALDKIDFTDLLCPKGNIQLNF